MKWFAYASVGLLALALAFHLGATSAQTSVVDQSMNGVVAAFTLSLDEIWVLDEDGTEWQVNSLGWQENPDGLTPLPVSVAEIKFWYHAGLVTYGDEVWYFSGPTGWVSCGTWPGSTSTTEQRSWAAIKAEHR